jgi:NADH-quinone oxidoreductase subunit J
VILGFVILAGLALASAIGVVVAAHPVHSALALIGNVVTLAVLYLLLHAEFLAAAQIIVYAGAIMVLFLFVVTLLTAGKEERELPEELAGQRTWAGIFAVLVGGGLAVFAVRYSGGVGVGGAPPATFGNLATMGRALWGPGFDYLAVLALMLLTASLGVMVMNRPERRREPAAPPASAEPPSPAAGPEGEPPRAEAGGGGGR